MSNYESVKQFTEESTNIKTPEIPEKMNKDEVKFLIKMVISEMMELASTVTDDPVTFVNECLKTDLPKNVCLKNDIEIIAEQGDACVDIWYYMLNSFCKKGVDLSAIFNEVHKANMNKKDHTTGTFIRREDGKILKPIGWESPNIVSVVEKMFKKKKEQILEEIENKYVIYPIKNDDIWTMYKKAVSTFWITEEVDMSTDYNDWLALSDNERHFISYVLAFFASSDGIVNENLVENFSSEIQIPEAKFFYGFQIAIENIHSETYSLLIDTYIKDREQKDFIFNSIKNISCIKSKTNWMLKWVNRDNNSFAERLVAFACIEGIFFSGAFCSIFWLKKRGIMKGLCFSNELISRDEGLHCDFACLLYSKLQNKLSQEKIYEIINDAIEIESIFVKDSLPVELIGMNSKFMVEYVKFCADRLIVQLGYEKLYKTENPFDWMVNISLQGKTNFFEKRVSEYSKFGINIGKKENSYELNFNEDF